MPAVTHVLQDPYARSLLLFPTKALAQDQLGSLTSFADDACPSLYAATLDGDTPRADRRQISERAHVISTWALTSPGPSPALGPHQPWALTHDDPPLPLLPPFSPLAHSSSVRAPSWEGDPDEPRLAARQRAAEPFRLARGEIGCT